MKAFTKTKYGGPEVLQLKEVEKPAVKAGHLLVKVMANSANPADWHIMRGKPLAARFVFGLFKPKVLIPGADLSGIVEEVGSGVSDFKIGDCVFGDTLLGGAFAEYACVAAKACAQMPQGSDFPEMAATPIAGITALQAIVTVGRLREGESVLINGSSGGVGHFAIQIAKAYGGRVTAVCSSRNEDFVRSLGVEQVIAYDRESIHEHEGKYDLIVDTNGNLSAGDFTRMGKRGVVTGFTTMGHLIMLGLRTTIAQYPLKNFTAQANTGDLETLAELIRNKRIKVHIDKTFGYKEIPEAIRYIESMRTRGKVVMVW